jgi:chromosome segregation ATPase
VGTRSIFSSSHGEFDETAEEKKAGAEGAAGVVAAAAAKAAAAAAKSATAVALAGGYSLVNPPPGLSSMESTDLSIQRKLAEHERSSLLERMSFALWSFDGAVRKLRREKFKLDADLKSTDLKILTLYQELHLLKAFEEKENMLFSKLSKARAAKAAVVGEMSDCEKQLSHKLSEIKAWQEKDKQVLSDFNLVVGGEKSEFYSALLKIFKKKVKRNKKKGGAGGGGGGGGGKNGDDLDNDDGDDSDVEGGGGNSSSDGSGSDDSDSDESDDDSCPLHLDSAIYEKVLELREKRLEQEEILSDFNRSVTELNKAYERLGGRERLIDKELSSTEGDIEAFQSEKQRALNQIDVTIPLKLHQMKFLTPTGCLPKDISRALIFTSSGLTRLQRRILELASEKTSLQKQFKELKKQHRVLLRELAARREEIGIEKAKCEDVQMLKFGQIIDLHILEKVGVDEGASELRAKLEALETGGVERAEEWDDKIEQARNELARITEQNTRWLDKVAKLTKAQYDLEDTLNHTRNVHVADSSPLDDQSDLERRQLLELVQLQEREIDALRAEVHVLRRKGGQVYTPQA